MSDWYARQFGDRDRFALSISFGRDPHPHGSTTLDATWGGVSLWVRGRCLTRNVSSESGVSDEVRWNLLTILEWLLEVGIRLVNEEPFPHSARTDHIRDAAEWFNETDVPLIRGTAKEDARWFLERSDWRQHHALRRAALDAALPNVVIRRLGESLEVSWDNETWGTPRSDVSFVEQRGTELVPARHASVDLAEAMQVVTAALAERWEELAPLAKGAASLSVKDTDWKWLVHKQTARVITTELPQLQERLSRHVRTSSVGLHIPHTVETLALRQVRLTTGREIDAFLRAAIPAPAAAPMKDELRELAHRTPAPAVRPWIAGYERALEVRDALGWGDEPAPDLNDWLTKNGVRVAKPELASSIDVIASRTDAGAATASINPRGGSLLRRETGLAAALGHILMDEASVAVEGVWEHWPTAARARAFAWMLLLPEEGIRTMLAATRNVAAADVKRVMKRFHTGPHATTFHLKNLRIIPDDETRVGILHELTS